MIDICIIGGGAAGMTAAIHAKEANPELDILILEKKNQLGKKILASGNGKCNLSNIQCENVQQTLDFFGRLGVFTRTDSEGRIYPYTEESRAILDALKHRIDQLGIQVRTSAEVLELEKKREFILHLNTGMIYAKKVLIACGGKAGSQFGTTGDGYRLAKAFGHRVEKPIPVLTAVDVRESMEKFSGIRVKGMVSLSYKDEIIFEEKGEIQFTKTGISGICVFNLSRYLLIPEGRTFQNGFDDYEIFIDFFPEEQELLTLLEQREQLGFTGERLLEYLVRSPIAARIYELAQGDIAESAALLKAFPLTPKGVKGWDFAQATKGGVSFDDVDRETLQSKLISGLYFAGEVLDFDGPCGGYNLQNAWANGALAGKEMAR